MADILKVATSVRNQLKKLPKEEREDVLALVVKALKAEDDS